MARHHYVPQFLLRNWGSNGRFVAYYFKPEVGKTIVNAKATVASACQIADLNTYFGVHASHRDFPETGFFTPQVDTPAATALQVMLKRNVRALSPTQRIDWARLLVSFAVRTPEALRDMGPKETRKAFALLESGVKGPSDDAEQKVLAMIRRKMMPALERNFPLNAAMDLSKDPEKLRAVEAMTWWLRRYPRPSILIGDRPLLTAPRARYPCGIALDNPGCLIVLPIAPNAVFFASANPKTRDKTRKMTLSKIAAIVNEEMIWRSSCVYFPDKSLGYFAMPRIGGKATSTWQPSAR